MEKQQHGLESPPSALSADASTMRWIAPLQSIKTFSIAEFTQFDSWPGSDGGTSFSLS